MNRRVKTIVVILGVFLCLCLFTFVYTSQLSNKNEKIIGIDVSHHQKDIDWKAVAKEGISFAYIKATEGATYVDPKFHENAQEAQQAGLLIGAYHYFRMTSSAHQQFANFKKAVERHEWSLIPMIDVETNDNRPKNQVQDSLDVLISLIKEEYGVLPMIYGTQRSYNELCAPKYNQHHLYIGRYNAKESPQIIGSGTYTIWQYTEQGKVRGISKSVDMCRFHPNHSLEEILLQ